MGEQLRCSEPERGVRVEESGEERMKSGGERRGQWETTGLGRGGGEKERAESSGG